MFEIDTRSPKLPYVVPKINVTTVEMALTINSVKPVLSLTGSLILGMSIFLFSISFFIVDYKKNGQIKQRENKICQTTPSFDPKRRFLRISTEDEGVC